MRTTDKLLRGNQPADVKRLAREKAHQIIVDCANSRAWNDIDTAELESRIASELSVLTGAQKKEEG
jgi:hypothetical protein